MPDTPQPTMAAATASDSVVQARERREERLRERQARRRHAQRVRRAILLLVPVAMAGAWLARPSKVVVAGAEGYAWPWTSVSDALADAGVVIPPGDLLDVNGAVIEAGGGTPGTALSAGVQIPLDDKAADYDAIAFERGSDLVEPAQESIRLDVVAQADEPWKASWEPLYFAAPPGVAGMTRRTEGEISGAVAVEEAIVTPLKRTGETPLPMAVALTFDDGPSGDYTRALLDILDQHDAKATFFVLGDNVPRQKGLVREMAERGHEIGNHSYGHPNLKTHDVSYALQNIAKAEAIISEAAGAKCRWFRPPYGNTTAAQRKAILEAGYGIAIWSCDTNDWRGPDANTLYGRIMGGVEPAGVVLMHSTSGDRTIQAVRRAVPEIKRMGYSLVTLSELEKLVAGEDAGIRMVLGEETYEARIPEQPYSVVVNGAELPGLHPMLACRGKVLVPVREVLEALDADYTWNAETQAVTIRNSADSFTLRMDSRRLSRGQSELIVGIPPMFYHDVPLVTADLIARVTGATLDTANTPGVISLTSAR